MRPALGASSKTLISDPEGPSQSVCSLLILTEPVPALLHKLGRVFCLKSIPPWGLLSFAICLPHPQDLGTDEMAVWQVLWHALLNLPSASPCLFKPACLPTGEA